MATLAWALLQKAMGSCCCSQPSTLYAPCFSATFASFEAASPGHLALCDQSGLAKSAYPITFSPLS